MKGNVQERGVRWVILLALCVGPLLRAQTTFVLSEGFEGAFPEDNGWIVLNANTNGPHAYWDDVPSLFGGEGAHGGNWKGYCAGFGYTGDESLPSYPNNMTAAMARSINLTNFGRAELRFWHKIPGIEDCCDQARVYVGGNLVWSNATEVMDWTEVVLDLAAYLGTAPVLRFEFYSDGSVADEGWYLDDILVIGVSPPSNDSCAQAYTLSDGVSYTMDTTAATSNDGALHCPATLGKGVWFRFVVPPSDGLLEVSTCDSSFDTVMEVYEDWCGPSRNLVACNDDDGPLCPGTKATVRFSAFPGAIYRILVGGYNGASGPLTITARWVDTTPPSISCPTNVSAQCVSSVPARPATLAEFFAEGGQAADNAGTNLTYTCVDGPFIGGACGGTILRTHTVTDDWTNSASCVQTITVRDTTTAIVCPLSVTVASLAEAPRRPTTMAEFIAQGGQAIDNCDSRLDYFSSDAPLAGSPHCESIARTHTVVDNCTNAASCVQVITVLDTIPPTITCPANVVTSTDPGKCYRSNLTAVLPSPLIVSDNCGVATVITSPGFDLPAAQFPVGVTPVTVTAVDLAGNSNSCTFTVTILDTEPPHINGPNFFFTFVEPGSCEKTNVIYPVTASDNCPGAVVWCEPPIGSTFPRGVTLVRCTGRDAAGNTNSRDFTVTISGFEGRGTDFSYLPPGAILYSSAYLGADDVLHLTDAVNGQQGTFVLPLQQPVGSFRASFKALVGDSTSADPADGFSFCVGNDLVPPFGEEGSGTGLIVSFDTFNNGGEDAPGIELKWNGVTFANARRGFVPSTSAAFVDVVIELSPAGEVTVIFDGATLHDAVPVPGDRVIPGWVSFGFGARTGSLNAKHWIDDLLITDDAPCPAPRLSIARSNATVVISWRQPAQVWSLQATTNLVSGAGVWTEIPPPYATNGLTNLLFSEPSSVDNKFYRLHRP